MWSKQLAIIQLEDRISANQREISLKAPTISNFLQTRPSKCRNLERCCGLALNTPKDIFSMRIYPLDPGEHILSQKLLFGVGVDMFASRNGRRKPKLQDCSFPLHRFFLPIRPSVGPCHCWNSFSPSKTIFLLLLDLDPRKSSYGSILLRALSMDSLASDFYSDGASAHPPWSAWTAAIGFCISFPS